MRPQKDKKGFTLVELSIVIVIVGLVVSGVTAGQSLVKQAKLRSVIGEYNKLKLAYQTFKLQYNYLPGDMPRASSFWPTCDATPTNCNGNGNKVIEWNTAIPAQNNENFRLWQHMSLAKVVPDKWDATITGEWGTPGVSLPLSAYPSKDGEGPAVWGMLNSGFVLGGLVRISWHECTMWPASDAVAPADAYSIDRKIDDGIRDKGKVLAGNGKRDLSFWSTQCESATDPSKYNINITGPGCNMTFMPN